MRRIGRIVPAHHQREVRGSLDQRVGRVLILIGRITKRVRRIGKMIRDVVFPVPVDEGAADDLCNLVRLGGQHRRLIHHANASQMPRRVKPR